MTLPIVMTQTGLQPQTPTALQQQIIAQATALVPTVTASLPGSLIEDMSSTAAGAAIVCDSAVVESIANVTPLGANQYVLANLGQIYGIQQGTPTNTSVYVTFTGTPGYTISPGFTVSDGSHQYVVQDGGIIGTGGTSLPLYCIATQTGTWAVPANTVTTLITSVPSSVTLTCTNPQAGTPSAGAESVSSFRGRIMQAGQAISQGMTTATKGQIQNVPGVQSRLVSILQGTGGFEVIAGGGDPYQIAYAIFRGMGDFSTLVGSVLNVTNITKDNPGVVTTSLNHGYTTGQVVTMTGVLGMTAVNGVPYTITVLSETTFSIGVNTSSYGAYTGGGVLSPNLRNITVSIQDFPNTYSITFVNPPEQTVSVALTWNTTATNLVSPTSVAALGAPAIVSYINSIQVGAPINLFELQNAFQVAVSGIIPVAQLTRMVFSVSINGVLTNPETGTGIIAGDPESYFSITTADVVIEQG